MTQLFDKSFGDLDKFPVCGEANCSQALELQNRFKCAKCLGIFCCAHRLDFKHMCPSLKTKPTEAKLTNPIVLPKCSEPGCPCKLTGINKFVCTKCSKSFCMAHRLDFVHKCVS